MAVRYIALGTLVFNVCLKSLFLEYNNFGKLTCTILYREPSISLWKFGIMMRTTGLGKIPNYWISMRRTFPLLHQRAGVQSGFVASAPVPWLVTDTCVIKTTMGPFANSTARYKHQDGSTTSVTIWAGRCASRAGLEKPVTCVSLNFL